MDEKVVPPFLFYESKAFREIEPLDRSLCHGPTATPLLLEVALCQMCLEGHFRSIPVSVDIEENLRYIDRIGRKVTAEFGQFVEE